MNKRIRKKQIRKALRDLIAAYDKFEAARKRAFRKALQDVADAHLEPCEEIQCYLKIASFLASSGPIPKSLKENTTTHGTTD